MSITRACLAFLFGLQNVCCGIGSDQPSPSQVSATLYGTWEPHRLLLQGDPSGGGLRLFRFDVDSWMYAGIDTISTGSSESVVAGLERFLKGLSDWDMQMSLQRNDDDRTSLLVRDERLLSYSIAGDERGLGIPASPMFLTCNYDVKNKWYRVSWQNPNASEIRPVARHTMTSFPFDTEAGVNRRRELRAIPDGTDLETRKVFSEQIEKKYRDMTGVALDSPGILAQEMLPGRQNLLIVTFWSVAPVSTASQFWYSRLRCPSAPGVLLFGPGYQSSFLDLPLGKKVIPNWMSWGGDSVELAVVSRDGIEDNLYPCSGKGTIDVTKQPQTYYQRFRNVEGARGGGIWRDYLGLTPQHTYRVRIRLNTLDMQPSSADSEPEKNEAWTFSVHATPGVAGKNEDLTYEQFMGTSSWADEKPDPSVGQIACYGPESTTRGEWVERVSGDGGPGSTLGDIALPEGCDRITVWLRCTGPIRSGVGMDWIQFEDRTIIEQLENDKP